jgi:hypothetical protein
MAITEKMINDQVAIIMGKKPIRPSIHHIITCIKENPKNLISISKYLIDDLKQALRDHDEDSKKQINPFVSRETWNGYHMQRIKEVFLFSRRLQGGLRGEKQSKIDSDCEEMLRIINNTIIKF